VILSTGVQPGRVGVAMPSAPHSEIYRQKTSRSHVLVDITFLK
jgi:hypothetical protein